MAVPLYRSGLGETCPYMEQILIMLPVLLYVLYQHQTYSLDISYLRLKLQKGKTAAVQILGNKLLTQNIGHESKKIRMIFLSDLHLNKYFNKKFLNSLIGRVNSLGADVLLFGGDYIIDYRTNVAVLDAMKGFKAKTKIAVLGNHDYSIRSQRKFRNESSHELYFKKGKEVENKLRLLGMKVLRNENYLMNFPQQLEINFFGLDSDWANIAKPEKFNPAEHNIVISHEPTEFESWNFKNTDLVLTGHNHGGQLRLSKSIGHLTKAKFLPSRIRRNIKEDYGDYSEGLYKNKYGLRMYLSRGIGTVLTALRINAKPEMVVIDVE